MKKALKIGIMGMIGFMLFIYGGLNGYCMAWSRLYDRGNHIGAYGLSDLYLLSTWTSSWQVIPNRRTDHESLREIVGSFIFQNEDKLSAASGGNSEARLGPRPAGYERERNGRWEPQPGFLKFQGRSNNEIYENMRTIPAQTRRDYSGGGGIRRCSSHGDRGRTGDHEGTASLWVLGILGSLCAAAITIDKVLEIIHKYIKKAQEPDNAQNKRLDELDKRIGTLEQGQLQHTQALARDLRRFEEIDEVSRLTLDGVRNLLDAQLSGNNREGMQKSRTDIDNYLLKGVTNHGSTGN